MDPASEAAASAAEGAENAPADARWCTVARKHEASGQPLQTTSTRTEMENQSKTDNVEVPDRAQQSSNSHQENIRGEVPADRDVRQLEPASEAGASASEGAPLKKHDPDDSTNMYTADGVERDPEMHTELQQGKIRRTEGNLITGQPLPLTSTKAETEMQLKTDTSKDPKSEQQPAKDNQENTAEMDLTSETLHQREPYEQHNSDDEFVDVDEAFPYEIRETDSQEIHTRDEDIRVKFYAVLWREYFVDNSTLHFIDSNGVKFEMKPVRSDGLDLMFTLDLTMSRAVADGLCYKYCLTINGKDNFETLKVERNTYRKLHRKPSDLVIHQFDDVCLQLPGFWNRGKSAEIDKIRSKFIQTTLSHLMYCNNQDFSEMRKTVKFFIDCVQLRVVHSERIKMIEHSLDSIQKELNSAFTEAIKRMNVKAPVQNVLAVAVLAHQLGIILERTSVDKLSEIVKQHGALRGTLMGLDESVRCSVAQLFNKACRVQSAKGVVWIMALYYAVSPEEHDQLLTFGTEKIPWTKAQSDFTEMVKTHSGEIRRHKAFASSVLSMFSAEHGNIGLLSHLSITPEQFLKQLSQWQREHKFHKLLNVISGIAVEIKQWFHTRSNERPVSETVKKEIHSCAVLMLNILEESTKTHATWTKHRENAYSSLQLLNSLSGYLDCLSNDKDLKKLGNFTMPIIMQKMAECIKSNWISGKNLIRDWTEVFVLRLPDIWQTEWEELLKSLFTEKIKKESEVNQVTLFCENSDVCPAMHETLLNCALDAINTVYKSKKSLRFMGGHQKIMMKCRESRKLVSRIIENELCDPNTVNHKDYILNLLFDEELTDLFWLMEKQKRTHPDYVAQLSEKAQELLAGAYSLIQHLTVEMENKSIPCSLMKDIVERKQHVHSYLFGQNKDRWKNGLEHAEKDFHIFEERKRKVRSLYGLNQGMPVDVKPLDTALKIDLSKEERSLKTIEEMLTSKEPESERDTYSINIQMFEKIDVLSKSTHFKEMWRERTKQVKNTDFGNVRVIPFDQVHCRIFQPTFEEFTKSYKGLRDLSITLNDLEIKFGEFIKNGNMPKELETMAAVFSDDTKRTWMEHTCTHIRRFRELQSVEENAKVFNDLKDHLGLCGDFKGIDKLGHMDHKRLRDLTEEVCRVGETVKNIPIHVISFLKVFDECVTGGFITWIKEIIKDTGELAAFVELASISAGENAMDIGKVCCFRDAISACTPLIYQLPENSGIQDLLRCIAEIKPAPESDKKLEDKLRDSCKNSQWLKIAYETHGSVERSSLRQATDINESGIYIIEVPSGAQSKVTLENCIILRCKEMEKKEKFKTYSLPKLKELQNKLMLITASAESQGDEITTYIEVLEHVINVGQLFLELREAGHILFQDWEMSAYCQQTHPFRIWVKFGIANVEIKGHRPLLEELKGLCESMRGCLSEWLKYMDQKRNTYYMLNHFTAKQLVYLCRSVAEIQTEETVSPRLLNMLSIVKANIEETDVRSALTKALQTPLESGGSQASRELTKFLNDYPDMIEYFLESGFTEEEIKAAIMFCEEEKQTSGGLEELEVTEEFRDRVMECIDTYQNDDEWVKEWCEKYEKTRDDVLQSQMKFKGGQAADEQSFTMTEEQVTAAFENLENSDEKIVMLWKTYHNRLSGLVSDKFVDLDVLGEMMNHLARSAEVTVRRTLQYGLEGGRPYLISCKDAEIFPLCLSLYSDDDQPLPTYDEILICTPDTTAEQVELIIRRAVQPGSPHEKIYSLLNADKLNHDVSRKLESFFYKFSKNQGGTCLHDYRLIIFCDTKAHHSYVATAFDIFKRTIAEKPNRNDQVKQYLRHKHQVSSKAETGFTKLHIPEQFLLRTKLVFSDHAGMGKSLYVKNLVKVSEEKLKSKGFTHTTIRITESQLRTEDIVSRLQQYEDKPMDKVPRIFHFDVPPVVTKGLYVFLLQLFVLRCFQNPDGFIWRCNDSHIYLVEYTKRKHRECDRHSSEITSQIEDTFLEMFPAVKCMSPEETQKHVQGGPCDREHQLMDGSEFGSEAFQRTYQYFKRYRENKLESFSFKPGSTEDSPKEWLECVLQFCDIKNPSWGELRDFTHFLSSQLKKSEESIFCSDALKDDLTGFKKFVVKFMITMSKDFSMRSLRTSDDSDEKETDVEEEDIALKEFQLRRRWEQQAHPYILFNADHDSMTFLGFHIHNLHAVDVRTNAIVEENIIDRRLFAQLRAQKVPFNVDFERLNRQEQLIIIGRVLGVKSVEDPDDTYELTLDNVMKMLAIHLRFESDIPVIIMGETGCGKTRLVQFMCDLMRSGRQRQNLIVVRVHGGTTSEVIYNKVRGAIKISKENEAHKLDTVLFFDEANTTEAVNAIKEVICDKSVNGEQIDAPCLKVIAACNPYRKHTQKAIEQLERAGLGYRVRCENTEEKLGQIPMRQLVYRVQPLPPSLTPLVWDFGKLNEHTQELYINQMVRTFFRKENLPGVHQALFTKVISASQKHMAELKDECRMVSLRDIERCMKTVMWFYHQKETLFPEIDKIRGNKGKVDDLVRSLILAVGVCYLASLENRDVYLERVSEVFPSDIDIHTEIELCKTAFISNVDCPPSVAKNDALKENVFMMVVCMNLRIPLFLVGKPGSSKSLSKTIAAHAMQGKASQSDLFKGYKQAQLASFQCSPHSSPDGIISIFRQCAQFQKDKTLDEYVAVVVLDEIGLAEDSPKMPLKTLHPLLEYGCVDDENPDDFKKVGFIGISNWSLDPAKMNRGILVLRTSPLTDELQNTACDICSSDKSYINTEMECLIPMLTEFYLKVLKGQTSEFFGLRDFYSLVKLIVSYATETHGRPSDEDLTKAVQRNFEGLDSINVLEIFWDVLKQRTEKCDTISLLKENLDMKTSGFTSRYLLLPTVNHAALHILKSQKIIDESNTEIIFGSGFPRDEEYSQVCRTVNRVKTCMETGRPVVLLNIQSLYESLYDALNQCYVKLGGSYYVDLGLGSHRVKCRVKDEFRLIVIEEKSTVYEQFPTPLLNRLEKHCLEISTILPEHAKRMQAELENWLDSFVAEISNDIYLSEEQSKEQSRVSKKKFDTIVGYTEDTCASVLLQCCPEIVSQEPDQDRRQEVFEMAQEMLLQCATPDAVLRATKYMENPEKFLEVYFAKQPHSNLIEMVKTHRQTRPGGMSLEVSTYHRLLNKRDVELICKELNIDEEQSRLFLLDEFYTEQSFSQTISEFLCDNVTGRKLLLLQTYFDDPKRSQRLLFCVRHCIAQLRSSVSVEVAFDVVLLTRLPRISGGCGYIASFGDDWISVHLDELIPTPGFPGDIYELHRLSVSEILKKSSSYGEEDQVPSSSGIIPPEDQALLVDTLFLLKKSLQKGILQLHDKADNTQRATKRIEILHGLLHKKYPAVSDTFIKFLEGRIISLLSSREKMEKREREERENWVITQALSEHFVAEGGSFRHMLWVYLEDTVASALAHILAVIDGDNNLDNLIEQPSEKSDLWLNVFREDELNLLKIPVTEFQGKVFVVSTSRHKDKSRTCHFPFIWVLKERFEQIWSNIINLKGPSSRPNEEYLETFEEHIPWTWIKSIKKDQELFSMFSEDLVNISMPDYPSDLNKSFSDILVRLTPRLYHDLTGDEPDSVSLPWLYVTNEYMHDNHQLFYNLFLQNEDLLTAGEATEALKQTLKCLQPKDSLLKDFASCQQWLQRVKSLSMTVDLILSEDSLVTRHAENAVELTAEVRLLWQSTRIVFLLMDHLLQNELEMEKKLLTILVRNLTFAWKKLNTEEVNQMEYLVEQVTGTLNKCSKNACNVFKVLCGYCDKEFTEDDTAELQCGHMFHITCLKAHNDIKCRKCKKDINQDYKPCGVIDKETSLKVNRFRRKCNSFLVEFMWNFVSNKEQLTDKVVDMLMDYMKGCQLTEDTVAEQSSLQLYMNPDPAVQSLVLKILLKCGMDETAPQLQRFIEEAVKPNERNADELYFMVVRSIEDHIYSSNQGCLSKKAKECLDTCRFINSDEAVISEDLHTIAKLRFAISVASDTIRTALSEVDQEMNEPLLRSLEQLISNTGNPWIQIFLLRNLCHMHGFSIVHRLARNERFQWTIPSEVFEEQGDTTGQVDRFLIYGEMYEGITGDAVKALKEPSDDFAQAFDQTSACFSVCMALAAVRQATLNPSTRDNEGSLIAKMKTRSTTDGSWSEVVKICENMLGNHLAEVDPGLSNTGDLSQIVFHTALVAKLSAAPEMELIKTLCFNPANTKDCFFPSMPSSINEIKDWSMDPKDKVKIWVCSCGEPVLIGNCGKPSVKEKCLNCQKEVGGEQHNPVEGFKAYENGEGSGKGHNLGDPNIRREQNGERNLYGANLSLVRAIIHSSMLWGTIEHAEEVTNTIQTPHDDVRRYLCGHLQKDIELLAKAIGKSAEDAQMAVHLFLKCMLEGDSEPNNSIQMTDTEQKREEWEDTVHKRLKVFFQNFDEELSSVQNSILQSGGMNTLAQIIYSREPQLKELPATGVFNRPLMWRFEQRMTIQHLTHLIEQDDERKNVPVLSELLKNHFHIKYIRYLPQVLRLQQKLMCSFENVDLQCYINVPINTFMKENVPDDGEAFTEKVSAVKEIWGHLKKINYPKLPHGLQDIKENDLMILDLLPMEKSVARTVTDYLMRMQNDFVNLVNPKADRVIGASEVKPSHVINCVPEQDFLTIAISNIDHVVNEDGKESTNYNFKAVERQLADRFFMEKPMIKITTLPLFEYNTGTTLRAFFGTVKDKLEPLNTNDRNCIMNDFRFLNEISAALSTLKIAIGFMKLSFPEPEQFLLTYLKKDLKLEDRAHTLSLPVLRTSRVKHIQSLWEVLSLRQSSLLIEMNQNPFFMIEDQRFHEVFTEEQKDEKTRFLAGLTNIDVLITELHYVIMNIKLKEVGPTWTIKETFEAFLEFSEIDEKAVECLKELQEVEMSHGIALWKLAVQIKKGIKATGSK